MQNTTHIFSSRRNSKHGFTLVELMIVIAIISLLAVALLPKLTGAQANARDVKRKKDLQDISAALEQVYDERGRYPIRQFNTGALHYDELLDSNILIPVNTGNIDNAEHRCLSTKNGTSAHVLMEQLDGGRVPTDPSMQTIWYCGEIIPRFRWNDPLDLSDFLGSYYYTTYSIIEDNRVSVVAKSYALAAKMENYRNANWNTWEIWDPGSPEGTFDPTGLSGVWNASLCAPIWCGTSSSNISHWPSSIIKNLKPLETAQLQDEQGNLRYPEYRNSDLLPSYLQEKTLFVVGKDHILEP